MFYKKVIIKRKKKLTEILDEKGYVIRYVFN